MPRDAGQITLIRTSKGWSAQFDGDVAELIISLFGSNVIPTAFTAAAPADKVKRELRAMWPKCLVTVEEGR